MTERLTERQQRFVEQYLISGNATDAARKAGYSEKTAGVQGPRLLGNVGVAAAIAAARAQRAADAGVTATMVVSELAKLGFSNMADYTMVQSDGSMVVDLSKLTRDQAAAIQEVVVEEYVEGAGEDARQVKRTKFKLASKQPALEALGRHFGIFNDTLNLNGKLTNRVINATPMTPEEWESQYADNGEGEQPPGG